MESPSSTSTCFTFLPSGPVWWVTKDRDDLADAYLFLRRAEHRIQMVEGRQTHRLQPAEAAPPGAHFASASEMR